MNHLRKTGSARTFGASARGRATPFALLTCGLLAALAIVPLGCKHKKAAVQPGDEATPAIASMVTMRDPKSAAQLLSGFHSIEADAWRWTARQFSVELRPPPGAAVRGAVLTLKLTVPQVTIDKLSSVTLTGLVNGTALAPETYSKPGNYVYKRDVPGNLLLGESAKIDFSLDKAIPPGDTDQRELGVIAVSVALSLPQQPQ